MKSLKLIISGLLAVFALVVFAPNTFALPPDGCEEADLKFFDDGGQDNQITYTGEAVSAACILTRFERETEGFHTGMLTEDQVFAGTNECLYTITGLGTTSVTVTSNSEACRPIHLDLFFGEPEPEDELGMSLALVGPSCGGNGFDVQATLTDGQNPLANYPLTFTYKGNVVPAQTDAAGFVQASFAFQGNDGVTVEAQGIDPQVAWVAFPNGCPGGGGGGSSVLGASTGEVLGTSTLAAAGSSVEKLMFAMYTLGSGLVLTGLRFAFKQS